MNHPATVDTSARHLMIRLQQNRDGKSKGEGALLIELQEWHKRTPIRAKGFRGAKASDGFGDFRRHNHQICII